MKKRLIIIISLIAALVLIGGTYFVLQHNLGDNGEPEEEKTLSIGINGYDEYDIANDVKKMTIDNFYGKFSFTPDPAVDGINDKSWFLDDLGGIKSDVFAVNDIALGFYTITATQKLEVSAEEYATYGFDEPELEVTLEFNDGQVYTYTFGGSVGISDTENDYYCYLMRSGDDAVYLVESYFYDKALISLKDVMVTQLYVQLENNTVIHELTFSGSAGESLKLKNDEDNFLSYHIVEPYAREADANAMNSLLGELDVINTDVTIEVAGTKDMPILESALQMYGLDNPARILNFKYTIETTASDGITKTITEGEHTLKMGIVYDNVVYTMVDDMNAIFAVPFVLLDSVYGASFDSIAVRNIYTEKLISIEELKFDTTFKTFDYKIKAATEVTSATLNDKSIDVSVLKSLYNKLASIAYSERSTDKPTAAPYMTITIKLTTGQTDVIQFTEYNSRRYFVTINGVGDLLVSYELVDDLLETLKTTDKTSLG